MICKTSHVNNFFRFPNIERLNESSQWDDFVLTEFDYGSCFVFESTKSLQSEKLNYESQVTPLTAMVKYKKKIWKTVVFHFMVAKKKCPLRDVPFCMQFIEKYLKDEKVSYTSILRVSSIHGGIMSYYMFSV